MTIDSDTIAAEQWCEKHECHLQMSCHVDAFLAGVTHANKKLEQVAREAFEAARETTREEYCTENGTKGAYAKKKHETFSDYWQQKTESREGE